MVEAQVHSMVEETKVYPVPEEWARRAFIDPARYEEMYRRSVEDPDGFWAEEARRIDWIEPFAKVKNASFAYPDVSIRWFEDGVLNVSANCIDRHLQARGDQVGHVTLDQ
jgi:acetyl-CoA synthetase